MSGKTQTFNLPVIAEELVRDNSSRTFYLLATILSLVMMAVIFVTWTLLPLQVPLFFTYPWGEGRLAPKMFLLILPAISLFFVIVNVIMGKYFRRYPVILSRVLSITSLTTTAMLAFALFGIIQSLI